MTRTEGRRAVIIGGSMAGLFCGVQLRAAGWEVEIYERAGEELASRGAGIATHDELYDAFHTAGIALRPEMGVPSRGRLLLAPDGAEICRCDMPQIMTSWGFIYRFLRSKFPHSAYHNGYLLETLSQHGERVTARFSNGHVTEADWLIGADGTRSTVRALVSPEIETRYCGYFAWRGLVDEAALSARTHALLDGIFVLNPAAHGHFLGYMVAGPNDDLRPGHRWYNWGWYRRADDATLREHLSDDDGRYYPQGIPHDRVRPALVNRLHEQAARDLAPVLREVIAATTRPFLQGIYEVESRRLIHERVVLIGDAAFTARPHVGLGVSKAAEDATSLAAALQSPSRSAALRDWEATRLAYGRAAVGWGQDLGSYIEAPRDDATHRAKAAFYRQPEVLMVQTAAHEPQRYLQR